MQKLNRCWIYYMNILVYAGIASRFSRNAIYTFILDGSNFSKYQSDKNIWVSVIDIFYRHVVWTQVFASVYFGYACRF